LLNATEIVDRLRESQRRALARDKQWEDNRSARKGDLASVAPDLFSAEIAKPIVANFVDTVARDMAELVAPLPAFQCASATMQSDAARKFADRRTKIAQNYVVQSKLERQMLEGADHFNTYGITVFYLEPDFDEKIPRICVEDPTGGYPEIDRWGRVVAYTKRWHQEAAVLAQMFPDFASVILHKESRIMPGSNMVELIRFCDKDQISLVLVSKHPVTLIGVANPLKETPVVLARRPWLHPDQYKGQFDDAIWIQIARDCLARLNLEAVSKSVQAPLALPSDVQEFAIGPDSIIRTNSPEKVRKVGLELPQGAFAESQVLMEEMRTGTRYPAARSGQSDASVVTGRGIQQLLGGFDSQVKAAQMTFKDALTDVIRMCFKMDELYWPNLEKSIRGQANGTPYELKYKPSTHIAGDTTCDVEYGFAAGMDPNRAVVMLLQLRAEKAFSRDFFVRQLPFGINVHEEQSKVDVEEMRDAIKQSIYGYVQSIPALAQQGMDPSDPVLKAAMLVKGLQKGESIEDVVQAVFAPPKPPVAPASAGEGMGSGGPPGMGGPASGLTDSGRMVGVPPGQAGQAPGGRPDLSVALAGLTSGGNPQMSSFVSRRRRI